MIQREVTDGQGTTWTCVQAYSGLQGKMSEKAAELAENDKGEITVVCTPTGGAQTVRLELADTWNEQLTDEELIAAIEQQRQ